MKIIMLSVADYAASGHKLCEAINRYTDHEIKIFTGEYHNRFKLPMNRGFDEVTKRNRKDVQNIVDNCDIVHLKGDWPPDDGYLGLKISHKPIVITISGSLVRKKEHGGFGKYSPDQYKKAKVRTSFTPDLLYPEFDGIWTPHVIDSKSKKTAYKKSDPPVFVHIPSDLNKKDTAFLDAVIIGILKKKKVYYNRIKEVSHVNSVLLKQKATIYCDQFRVGFYGNSALEAMQYGIPVACFMRYNVKNCPVITEKKDINLWVNKLIETLESNLLELSVKTKVWCDGIHSYQSAADLWNKIYNAI